MFCVLFCFLLLVVYPALYQKTKALITPIVTACWGRFGCRWGTLSAYDQYVADS